MSGEFEVLQQMQESENNEMRRKLQAVEETVRQQGRVLEKHDKLHELHNKQGRTMMRLSDSQMKMFCVVAEQLVLMMELALMMFAVMLLSGVVQAPWLWKILYSIGVLVCAWGAFELNCLEELLRRLRGAEDEEE